MVRRLFHEEFYKSVVPRIHLPIEGNCLNAFWSKSALALCRFFFSLGYCLKKSFGSYRIRNYRGLLAHIESGTASELLDVQVIMTDDFQQETVNLVFILYDAVQRLI